ncbi:uncharacterized protein RAG0_01308 [Rhynchosporium agropyri]|uniref:Uncharacterized protein n=1 Tax=Rhynchosporium agropyri TaxID=914238 RepID=A0A1E1JWY0_9HELO|nr:uncharacterized protein RAG0_01308 [Rhynchosporium agropyri]
MAEPRTAIPCFDKSVANRYGVERDFSSSANDITVCSANGITVSCQRPFLAMRWDALISGQYSDISSNNVPDPYKKAMYISFNLRDPAEAGKPDETKKLQETFLKICQKAELMFCSGRAPSGGLAFAVTVIHETAHAVAYKWLAVLRYKYQKYAGSEPFFENEVIAELGFSLGNALFGGTAVDIFPLRRAADHRFTSAGGILQAGWNTTVHEQYKVD